MSAFDVFFTDRIISFKSVFRNDVDLVKIFLLKKIVKKFLKRRG